MTENELLQNASKNSAEDRIIKYQQGKIYAGPGIKPASFWHEHTLPIELNLSNP